MDGWMDGQMSKINRQFSIILLCLLPVAASNAGDISQREGSLGGLPPPPLRRHLQNWNVWTRSLPVRKVLALASIRLLHHIISSHTHTHTHTVQHNTYSLTRIYIAMHWFRAHCQYMYIYNYVHMQQHIQSCMHHSAFHWQWISFNTHHGMTPHLYNYYRSDLQQSHYIIIFYYLQCH